MNKSELEIARKIAEIDGKSVINVQGFLKETVHDMLIDYNPFDWSILGPLIVEYFVCINTVFNYVFITTGIKRTEVHFDHKSELPKAILECIIKSQEK